MLPPVPGVAVAYRRACVPMEGTPPPKAGPLEVQHTFNPDLYKMECMNNAAISYDGNKYFAGGVLTGVCGSALVPRSQIIYIRAAPFLALGLAGILADWWENSVSCTAKTHEQFQSFLASQQKQR